MDNNLENNNIGNVKTKKKTGVILAVISLILILIVGGILVYIEFFSDTKTKKEPKSEDKNPKVDVIGDSGEEAEFYRVKNDLNLVEYDFDGIDLTKNLTKKTFVDIADTDNEGLILLENGKVYYDMILDSMDLTTADVTLKDGTLTMNIKFNDGRTSTKTFDNVEKVYYYGIECSGRTAIIMYRNNKVYYRDFQDTLYEDKDLDNIFTELGKYYESIHLFHNRYSYCGASYVVAGKTETGEFYDLAYESKFDIDNYHYYDGYDLFVKIDRKFRAYTIEGKAKLVINHVDSNLQTFDNVMEINAIVDTNNYVYIINVDGVKKLSNSKVNKVEIDTSKQVVVFTFEDESRKQVNGIIVE